MQIGFASRTSGYGVVVTSATVPPIGTKRTIQLHSISSRPGTGSVAGALGRALQMTQPSDGQGSFRPCIQIELVNEITPCLHEGGTVLQ